MRIVSLLLVILFCLPVHAASSPWFETDGARMRLLAKPASGGLEAALQIEMEPGFKTYWQVPGASGVPPVITLSTDPFATSIPGATTTIRWPTPKVYRDGSGLVTGYKESVTFPIDLLGAGDVISQLVARGLIGVCGEICIPVQFSLTAPLTGPAGSNAEEARAFAAAQASITPPATVPVRVDGNTIRAAAPAADGPVFWVSTTQGTSPIEGRRDGNEVVFDAKATAGDTGLIVTESDATRAIVSAAD